MPAVCSRRDPRPTDWRKKLSKGLIQMLTKMSKMAGSAERRDGAERAQSLMNRFMRCCEGAGKRSRMDEEKILAIVLGGGQWGRDAGPESWYHTMTSLEACNAAARAIAYKLTGVYDESVTYIDGQRSLFFKKSDNQNAKHLLNPAGVLRDEGLELHAVKFPMALESPAFFAGVAASAGAAAPAPPAAAPPPAPAMAEQASPGMVRFASGITGMAYENEELLPFLLDAFGASPLTNAEIYDDDGGGEDEGGGGGENEEPEPPLKKRKRRERFVEEEDVLKHQKHQDNEEEDLLAAAFAILEEQEALLGSAPPEPPDLPDPGGGLSSKQQPAEADEPDENAPVGGENQQQEQPSYPSASLFSLQDTLEAEPLSSRSDGVLMGDLDDDASSSMPLLHPDSGSESSEWDGT